MLKINNHTGIALIAALSLHAIFGGDPTPPPAAPTMPVPSTEMPTSTQELTKNTEPTTQTALSGETAPVRNWIDKALQQAKESDYFYQLLDDRGPNALENEIDALEAQTPALNRTAALDNKVKARLIILQEPSTLTPDQQTHIKSELEEAKATLQDKNRAIRYLHLGHKTYTFIKNTAPPLLTEFQGKTIQQMLRMAAQFLISLMQGKSIEEAFNASKNPILAEQNLPDIAGEEGLVAKALGDVLFLNILDTDKQKLITFVQKNAPSNLDAPDVPYLNNIIKEYINILQCRRIGPACTEKEPEDKAKKLDEQDKAEDKTKSASPTKAPGDTGGASAAAPNADNLKIIDSIVAKLLTAESSLKMAKGFLSSVSAGEKQFIKSTIKKTLSANNTLKVAADTIVRRYGQNMPPQYAKFVKVVEDIQRAATGF
jgi:hypothetical protein